MLESMGMVESRRRVGTTVRPADKLFHQTLLEASGDEMFRALTGVVAEMLTGRTPQGMMPENRCMAAIALHGEVARAILDEAASSVVDDPREP